MPRTTLIIHGSSPQQKSDTEQCIVTFECAYDNGTALQYIILGMTVGNDTREQMLSIGEQYNYKYKLLFHPYAYTSEIKQ